MSGVGNGLPSHQLGRFARAPSPAAQRMIQLGRAISQESMAKHALELFRL